MTAVRASLAALFLSALLWAPLAAEDGIALDAGRRAALAGLPALRGPALGARGLAGQVVVLGFFASWCPPCGPEFDSFNRIQAEFADEGVRVVAVNIFESHLPDRDGARMAAFLARKAPAFHVLAGGEGVAELFGPVTRIPTAFVFGRDGRPALHFIHLKDATKTHASLEELRAAVRAAL